MSVSLDDIVGSQTDLDVLREVYDHSGKHVSLEVITEPVEADASSAASSLSTAISRMAART